MGKSSKIKFDLGLSMGSGESELFQKSLEPKISIDRLTFSEPNCPENFYWDGFRNFELSESRSVPNCSELYRTKKPKLSTISHQQYLLAVNNSLVK